MDKKKRLNEKGVFSFYLIWLVMLVILIILFAFTVPVALNISSKMYTAGESQIDKALESINKVQDANVKTSLTNLVTDAKDAQITNVDIMSNLIMYSPFIIMGLIAAIIFLAARQSVEAERGLI